MKKYILVLFILVLFTGCGKSSEKKDIKKDNDTRKEEKTEIVVNKNEEINKDQVVDGNLMRNTSVFVEDGISYFVIDVTNNTGKDYSLEEYVIIVKDTNGNEIVRIPGYIGSILKNGETKTIKSSINMDLSSAGSIEYEVVK